MSTNLKVILISVAVLIAVIVCFNFLPAGIRTASVIGFIVGALCGWYARGAYDKMVGGNDHEVEA